MNNKKTMPDTQVITGKVRLGFVKLFKAEAMNEGDKKKFSCQVLIPKADKGTIKRIRDAVEAAIVLGVPKFGGKRPSNLKLPLRDGDEEHPGDEDYEGMYFLSANANSDKKPGIIDLNKLPIVENPEAATGFEGEVSPEDVYSGCWAKVSINFYAFNIKNKGIACGLNNVLMLADGVRLSGGASAEADFEDEFSDDDLMG